MIIGETTEGDLELKHGLMCEAVPIFLFPKRELSTPLPPTVHRPCFCHLVPATLPSTRVSPQPEMGAPKDS